jgi:hypothetical protein
MKKMQRRYLKIVGFLLTFIFLQFQTSFCQVSSFRLRTADSLFRAKQYVQSLEHYEEILKQNSFTPAMLLKMAFIHEGLVHVGPALYYLNLYYRTTRDKTALDKMEELANKYSLRGYEKEEGDDIISAYHDNRLYISLALAALMIFMLSLTIYSKVKLHRKPIASFSILCIFTVALLVNMFYGEEITTGIVANPETYVMTGPSGGSSVLDIIGDGHRLTVLGKKDVWVQVEWNNSIGFVKQTALLN